MPVAIEISDLTKTFPSAWTLPWQPRRPSTTALDHVTLEVREGEIYGLIGPNGAGKTTLLKVLSTLLLPTSGVARVLGHDVVREERAARSSIALVTNSERSFYYRLDGWQNLRYFAGLYGLGRRELERRARPFLRSLGLERVMHRDYRTYSTGMQRKLAFVRAFVLETPVLLLDEPTSSLDPASALEIRRTISEVCRERHQTVLLSANNLLDVERLADRVGMMSSGHLIPITEGGGAGPEFGMARWLFDDPPERVEALLGSWLRRQGRPDVARWEIQGRAEGTRVRLWTSDPEVHLPLILAEVLRGGLHPQRLDLRGVDLEEEFLRNLPAAQDVSPEAT